MYARNHITPDSALGGWQMKRSLRWEGTTGGTYAYLYRTGSSPTGGGKYSYSSWIKRVDLSGQTCLWGAGGGSQTNTHAEGIYITGDDQVALIYRGAVGSGSVGWYAYSSAKLRDVTSWVHVMLTYDNSQSGIANKIKYYFNGVEISYGGGVGSPGDLEFVNKSGVTQYIGRMDQGAGPGAAKVYQAETHVADGYIWTPSDFGYTDAQTGQWRPKRPQDISVNYGNNGFYLDYADNTSTSTIGIDRSGNSNNWTASGFSVSAGSDNDSVTDTPTNNFPTLNTLDRQGNAPTDGNLRGGTAGTSGWRHTRSTVPLPSSGKWYWEYKVPDASADASNGWITGIAYSNFGLTQDINSDSTGLYGRQTDSKYNNSSGSPVTNSHFTSPSNNDILQFAYDADSQTLFTGRNNTWELSANPSTGANPNWTGVASGGFPMVGSYGSSRYVIINFGQQPFSYTPPTGYRSLSGKNRATPSAAQIVRPQRHFDTILYTGNGTSGHSISGLEFKPDFIWIKNRDATYYHNLADTVRGITRSVNSNANDAEVNYSNISAVHDHGFVVGSAELVNKNSQNLVAWCWKAGGAAVSNTDGDITSSVSVNEEAGFSIATYTGSTASGALTVGHGLGKKPAWVMIKRRDASSDWIIGHQGLTTNAFQNNKFLKFSTNGTFTKSLVFGAEPTTTVTQIVTDGNAGASNLTSSGTYVMYSWAEIPGYSKFGSYTGNGSTDGTYVHLGFKPAYLMIKNQNNGFNWVIQDYKRSPTNLCDNKLNPDSTAVEQTDYDKLDMLSNGFKPRVSDAGINASSSSYVYMAFAERPTRTFFGLDANAR